MAKLFFFNIILYTCHVKTHSGLNTMFKKTYEVFPKNCSKMSKKDIFYLKIDDRIKRMIRFYLITNVIALIVHNMQAHFT